MHTKIVYTLVSDASDYYLEQALISVYSLRIYNPDTVVELVVDTLTAASLEGTRAKIKKYVTHVISIEAPNGYNKMLRSRFLKTTLRQWVTGDYLFVDCDTFISRSLEEIDLFHAELGLVADLNENLPLTNEDGIQRCRQIGFTDVEGKPYFNSGVMYVKDTSLAHTFYEKWHRNWFLSTENGVCVDQPALCQTNMEMQYPIQELPAEWNCQFKYSYTRYLKEARILHFFSGGKPAFIQEQTYRRIKTSGRIDSITDYAIRHPKTIVYATYAMPEDKAYEFYNSYMSYLFFCAPPVFRLLEKIGRWLVKPMLLLSKMKHCSLFYDE